MFGDRFHDDTNQIALNPKIKTDISDKDKNEDGDGEDGDGEDGDGDEESGC